MAVLRRLPWRWILSGIGVALLALLVWLFAPLIPFFEDPLPRLAVVLAMFAAWAITNLLITRRRRRRDAALAAGIAAPMADARGGESAEEVAALGERLSAAMATLRKARGTRGYLYEQPWYAIIGPPGAGKTTALLNAGLKFPLAAEMGQGAVAGVGGTRMCDWWFTEDAVLIDTAGRYTTQDSNAEIDRAGWEGFLALLRRTRPRQPLNGVLVAIAVSDIAGAPAEERIAHARAVRRRIKELEAKLAIRLPVYAILTKADLLAGFTEFFDDLDRERREQVWGATFALDPRDSGTGPVEGFAAELRLLVDRLNDRLLARLQAERSPERRALIAGFPTQVASLEGPVTGFLGEAFGGSRMDPAPMLRGVYLASGTQEGTPIDRLAGAMARSFGIDQQRAPSLRPEAGRSYFLHRLLKNVIFGEAMLGSQPPQVRRRNLLLRGAAFAGVLIAALLAGGALLAGRAEGETQLDATAKALAAYETGARDRVTDPVADSDLPRLLPLLDDAGRLAEAPGGPEGWLPSLGLSQRAKLVAGAGAVYRHALDNALLPRLIWRLEAQMRGNLTRPDFLYEASRVYLMLGNQGPLDRALVREWMTLDWRNAFPGAFNAPVLASLRTHLDRLLEGPLPNVALDGELIAQARATFSRVPLAARVYSRIKPSAAAQAVPPWRPSEALGAAGQSVFVRPSGQPLNAGIPGFFTVTGFHRVLLPALTGAVREVASESWVLGRDAAVNLAGPELRGLEEAVVALYVADYAAAWDAMLGDLDVVPLRSITQASQDLYILSSPQSPMRTLLESIARQLTLSEPPPPPAGVAGAVADAANRAGAAATSAVASERDRLFAALGGGPAAAPVVPPGTEIDRRYGALRDLVAGGAGAPLSQLLKLLNDLQQQLARLAAAPVGNAPVAAPPGPDPTLALRAEAQRQPQPVSRWLLAMAGSGNVLRGGGARQQVAAAYNGAGGPAALCPLAVNGRFPFVPGSSQETPLDDFGKLFAPGGLIDGFFNTQLRPYVDTSGPTWRPQAANGVPAPVSQADVAQFQRAAAIRDLFFSGGAATPSVRFDITPASLDAEARQVSLDFDGTSVTYAHGPPRTTQITWPGPTRMQNVRLVFDPPPAGGTGVLSDNGPWAMFRTFNRGTLRPAGSPERFTLAYQLGARQVAFEIRAGSVNNPFAPGLLQEFRCPRVE